MEITYTVIIGGIKFKRKFTNVVAAYTKDGILNIHTIVNGKHTVRQIPFKSIRNFTQKYPA